MTQIFSPKGSTILGVTTTPTAYPIPRFPKPDLSGNAKVTPGMGVDVVKVSLTTGTLVADDSVIIKFGDASVVADLATGHVIRLGQVDYIQLQPDDTHVSVATTAGTAGIVFTVGSMR